MSLVRKTIDAFWDRKTRNDINDNFRELFKHYIDSGLNAEEALKQAKQALENSDEFLQISNDLQKQINDLVLGDGTSIAEVVQARDGEEVLNDRLNKFDEKMEDTKRELDYQLNKPLLKNGVIKLPADFPEIPFEVSRKGKRNFIYDVNPLELEDFSDATHIYIASEQNSVEGIGTSYNEPIRLRSFHKNLQDGKYDNDTFIVNLMDNIISDTAWISLIGNSKSKFLFRSRSSNGFSWIGRVKVPGLELDEWELSEGLWKTKIVDGTTHDIKDIVNLKNTDSFNVPRPYKKVDTFSQCKDEVGTFYQDDVDIYCNPHKKENPKNLIGVLATTIFDVTNDSNKIMFDNVGFLTNTQKFKGETLDSDFFFFNCIFYRGSQDALGMRGKYKVYLLNCLAPFASKDGFNYHSDSGDSLAVEINCMSWGSGQYKLEDGNTTRNSNNGSTAHDGMNMLRIGCKYWDNEGATVADTSDVYSISIGCEVSDILPSTTGHKTAFRMNAGGDPYPNRNPKYIIECLGNGKNIEWGIQGTDQTYYMDFEGNDNIEENVKKIVWEEVVND